MVEWNGTSQELREAAIGLAEVLRYYGYDVRFTSAFRSRAKQEALYARRHLSPYPVARPGTSKHERGLAFDVVVHPWPGDTAMDWLAGELGLSWSPHDRVHFSV